MILGIDPGTRSPGFAVVDPTQLIPRTKLPTLPRVVWVGQHVYPHHVDIAAVEGQWFRPGTKQGAIYTLAFSAGWYLHASDAREKYRVMVADWKPALFTGRIVKSVFCNRLERELLPSELALIKKVPRAARMDLLDAIGIAWAVSLGCRADRVTLPG